MIDRFKFRVWNHKMQKFHIVFSMHGIVNDTLEGYAKDDNFVLEQCTGLKDKNGKLIYEGDILKNIEQRIKVVFDEQRYCFIFEYQDTKAYKPISCVDVLDDNNLEVIGNIHENADLSENEE